MSGAPTEGLKAAAIELGFDRVGVCDAAEAPHADEYAKWLAKGYHGSMEYLSRHAALRQDPARLLTGVASIVAVGLNYNQELDPAPGRPKIARYALGRDYHRVMRGKLARLAKFVESDRPGAKCRACVDSAPIFERDWARLAGLGWFGKNTMLIDSKRGSWFFIGLLLTTERYAPDKPAVGGCGTCRACIDACPTGAIVHDGDFWQVDSRRCVSYLTIERRGDIEPELAAKIGDWTFGCDVCQEVCPFNSQRPNQPERAKHTTEPDFAPRSWPSLEELAQVGADDWDRLTRGSAVRRTGLAGLRRNARINVENRTR